MHVAHRSPDYRTPCHASYCFPQMTHNQAHRIFADFNNVDSLGRVRLNTRGTLEEIKSLDLKFCDGMRVLLDDGEEFVVAGIVHHCPKEGWVAVVDWQAINKR